MYPYGYIYASRAGIPMIGIAAKWARETALNNINVTDSHQHNTIMAKNTNPDAVQAATGYQLCHLRALRICECVVCA